jgi:hypothetical protein
MINDGGEFALRVLGGVLILILSFCPGLSFSYSSELFLTLSCYFAWLCRFFLSFVGFCDFPSSR